MSPPPLVDDELDEDPFVVCRECWAEYHYGEHHRCEILIGERVPARELVDDEIEWLEISEEDLR